VDFVSGSCILRGLFRWHFLAKQCPITSEHQSQSVRSNVEAGVLYWGMNLDPPHLTSSESQQKKNQLLHPPSTRTSSLYASGKSTEQKRGIFLNWSQSQSPFHNPRRQTVVQRNRKTTTSDCCMPSSPHIYQEAASTLRSATKYEKHRLKNANPGEKSTEHKNTVVKCV